MKKKIMIGILSIMTLISLSGCAMFQSKLDDIRGKLIGVSFTIDTFDNFGNRTLTTNGTKINIKGNRVEEKDYTKNSTESKYSLSSVISIYVDGDEIESCGDTCIFYEKGLSPSYNFAAKRIESESHGLSGITSFAGIINGVKNKFGKKRVVVVKSQTGSLIYAFSGNKIYWEIPNDLPKFTRLNVDGKALYIHRANFQIIDTSLL